MRAIESTESLRTEPSIKIMLVDDRNANLVALEEVLRPLGHELVTATSGDQALKLLLKEDFALIILDVAMPNLDGFETAAYMKQLERTRHIPIIFVTAINREFAEVFRGYSVGAVDYVLKPFDPSILRSKVSVFADLHAKNAALRQSEERFRRAFLSAPSGVALLSLEGKWLRVNEALCDMLGHVEEELRGRPFEDVVVPEDQAIATIALEQVRITDGHAATDELRLARPDGKTVVVLVGISLIHSAGESPPYFVLQVNDITERKQSELFRERFIAQAAHELRTPLASIMGASLLLGERREKIKDPTLLLLIDTLDRQVKRLRSLVNNLLDLADLQQGRLKAHPEVISLSSATKRVLENTPPPEDKSVEMQFDGDLSVLTDSLCLEQMLTNLIINAYRYGGPRVTVEANRAQKRIVVTVADDGPGVPPDLVPRLFEPFTRGENAATIGGSGLGLSIVRNLAETCGGEILYEPGKDGGARFSLGLPEAP